MATDEIMVQFNVFCNWCNDGKIEYVKHRIKNGQDINQIGKTYNETALHYASREGQIEIVKLLLKHGAKKDILDIFGHSPLFLAERENKKEIIKLLK